MPVFTGIFLWQISGFDSKRKRDSDRLARDFFLFKMMYFFELKDEKDSGDKAACVACFLPYFSFF